MSLSEERAVRESLIVEMDDIFKRFRGLGHGLGSERDGLIGRIDIGYLIQTEGSCTRSGTFPDDAVTVIVQVEVQFDVHIFFMLMDDAVFGKTGPDFAPERPGDGIDDRSLAGTVVSGNSDDLKPFEIDFLVFEGLEVMYLEPDRDQLLLQIVFEFLTAGRMSELSERFGFDLSDTFTGNVEFLADFFQCAASAVFETESHGEHSLLTR